MVGATQLQHTYRTCSILQHLEVCSILAPPGRAHRHWRQGSSTSSRSARHVHYTFTVRDGNFDSSTKLGGFGYLSLRFLSWPRVFLFEPLYTRLTALVAHPNETSLSNAPASPSWFVLRFHHPPSPSHEPGLRVADRLRVPFGTAFGQQPRDSVDPRSQPFTDSSTITRSITTVGHQSQSTHRYRSLAISPSTANSHIEREVNLALCEQHLYVNCSSLLCLSCTFTQHHHLFA
jgi:hypothetical protein